MEFNINPYYDDFEQNAKLNNYLKILFKPGASVQARELTQIQSILQNQIKAFGDHIFQDGSPVVGGNLSLDNKVSYLKLDETFNNEDIELEEFDNRIILRDSDSAVQAKVLAVSFPAGGSPTLMVKYMSGLEFEDGDVFKVAGTTRRAKCIDSAASGKGTVVSINQGIFYVDGYFVQVNQQTAVVDAYSQQANVKIGLEISDEVIDYVADSTLLDPALGSFNYQAPGADRYQFNLTLTSRSLTTIIDESKFFELMRVENGAITKQVKYPIYSEIEKTLARRTFDESGDYTVIPFRASVAESINTDNYIINIEPGKAYVKGFEFETLGTFKLETPKPRDPVTDVKSLNNIDLDTKYGNYLIFKDFYGSSNANAGINIAAIEKVDLHCVPYASLNVGADQRGSTANTWQYGNTKIGTARVRNIVRDAASIVPGDNRESNGTYKIYLTDIDVKPKVISMNTTGSGLTSNTLNLTLYAAATDNAYQNVAVTVLPIKLTPVSDVTKADVYANGYIFANSATANTFYDPTATTPNVANKIIRVGDEVRQVVNIGWDATDGDYLIANTGFTANVVGADIQGGILQVFVQEDYTSNTTGQTRVIERYDGASRIAYLDRAFDEGAIADTLIGGATADPVLQLNFGIKDIESLAETPITISTLNAGMTVNAVADISVKSRLIDGSVELFENADNTLLYKLPKNYVKRGSFDTKNVQYNYTKHYENQTVTSGSFTINFESYESRPWALTNSGIEENLIVVVQNVTGGTTPNGTIMRLTTANVTSTVGGLSIDLNNPDINRADVYVKLEVSDAETRKKSKSFKSSNNYYNADSTSTFNYPDDSITGAGSNITVTEPNVGVVAKINIANGLIYITDPEMTDIYPGDSISLYVPDVVKIRKVLKGNVTHFADVDNFEDITDHFNIDYGQRDDLYDHCKLILKQGYPTPYAKLTVHVDYYLHTYPVGASYFSVDSYDEGVYNAGTIPIYYSSKNGSFNLQDCIDFRPTRNIGNPTVIQTGLTPHPDSATELSFSYFLPRIDKLVLSKNKEFRIIQGVADPKPLPPADESDSMTLYQIYLPPYVTNVNDIRLKYIENKRYTMKDIAKLDKRIERVEYYTALNNIETKALDDTSQYEDGTSKEKFGIIGENFENFNISDYRHPDFNVSMDENNMTPFFKNKVNNLKLLGTNNADENERTITLGYTETAAITQGLVSGTTTQVQPFLFASFIGDMKLKPEIDSWIAVDLPPEIIKPPEYVSETKEPEVTKTVVIVERCRARTTIVTVPTQAVNNSPALTEVPFTDPPAILESDKRPKSERVRKNVISNEPVPPTKRKLRPIPDPLEAANQVVPDFVAPLIFPSVIETEDPPYDPPTPDSEEPFTIGQKPLVASKTKFDNSNKTDKPTGY